MKPPFSHFTLPCLTKTYACQGPSRRRIAVTRGAPGCHKGVRFGSFDHKVVCRVDCEGREAWECRRYKCKPLQYSAKAVIRFNTADAVCMIGRMCHQASTYSHSCAHSVVVSTEQGGCTFFCTHQTEKRQVGAQQDLAATCTSCETCPFFGGILWNPWLNT